MAATVYERGMGVAVVLSEGYYCRSKVTTPHHVCFLVKISGMLSTTNRSVTILFNRHLQPIHLWRYFQIFHVDPQFWVVFS